MLPDFVINWIFKTDSGNYPIFDDLLVIQDITRLWHQVEEIS
ncbi:hypothetical protein [Calothrix sp. FACHB-1219]